MNQRADLSEIERLIIGVLETDAKEAMTMTDTTERLRILSDATDRYDRSRTRRRVMGVVAATAAAAAAIVVVVSTRGADPGTAPEFATQPTEAQLEAQAEQLSTDFFNALAEFDRDGAATYLAAGAEPTLGGIMLADVQVPWTLRNRFDEATGRKVTDLEGCSVVWVRVPGTIDVRCAFTAQMLGSEQLGRGPFGSQTLDIVVHDGAIVATNLDIAHNTNGFARTMYEPFWQWMDTNYPNDVPLMAAFEDPSATTAQVEESLQHWHKRVQEYVDAVEAGQAK